MFQCISCTENESNNKKEDKQILARVGNDIITVDEFRKNYELGFSNLKSGENRKKTYLDYMINEKLLSGYGIEKGLENSEYVKKSSESLMRELMIEQLIKIKVKDKIKVSVEEIKEYINKSKVQFKFRYWAEPTIEKAKIVATAMKERGYADVVEEILLNNPESRIDPIHYETDYFNNEQVSPEILLAIKDLPYGDISEPLELKNKFFIFQVVDIRRNSVTENEYNSRATSVEQVIYYQKFERALVEYGTNLMESKKIKIKRKAFNLLADAISEWKNIDNKKRMNFEKYLSESKNNFPALMKVAKNSDESFSEYSDGIISIKDFITSFNTYNFLKDFKNNNEYINYLHTNVAQSIRDIFLVREAKLNNLDGSPSIKKELDLWKDKWVYEELRNRIIFNSSVKKTKKDNIKTTLLNKIEKLKNLHKIEINESILDTINVIDFEKSKWASMQILKSGSNRPAYPVVDPRLELIKN